MQPLYEYVCHLKGHRNSKGELAEWVIKSHETGEILSSHKSEKKAKEHLQQMHIFKESVDSMSYKLLGESTYGTDMDNRVKIFMEGVSQLGLSKNQVDAIGKITKVCMESMEDGDFDDPSQYGGNNPYDSIEIPQTEYGDLGNDNEEMGATTLGNDIEGMGSMDFGDVSDGNKEIGLIDISEFGNDGDVGEIGKISEDQDEQPEF